MVGPTLIDIREHIEALATEDGQYYIRCGRTGDRPVPATRAQFPDRATARAAARATEQYRSALRRYDPQVPYYDLIVCEEAARDVRTVQSQQTTPDDSEYTLSDPVITKTTTPERRELIEFCHRVAGTVFETLSDQGHNTIETAVMDAYFDLAETVDDPDELCLCLLESIASELDGHLSPADQTKILTDAATRLEPTDDVSDPLDTTLSALEERGLIERSTRSPWSVDLDGGTGSVVVTIDGYALKPRDGRLPVLPLTLELFRHQPQRVPKSVDVASVDVGWQLTFDLGETTTQNGLVSAPIDRQSRP